jgi:hypothetical protein
MRRRRWAGTEFAVLEYAVLGYGLEREGFENDDMDRKTGLSFHLLDAPRDPSLWSGESDPA